MAVLQNLFTELQTQMNADASLNAFIAQSIIYGNQDKIIQSADFPFLIVEPGGLATDLEVIPNRTTLVQSFEIRGKIQQKDSDQLILDSFKLIELTFNSVLKDQTINKKALKSILAVTSMTSLENTVREIIMTLDIHLGLVKDGQL